MEQDPTFPDADLILNINIEKVDWTKEESEKFLIAIQKYQNWPDIANFVQTRDETAC